MGWDDDYELFGDEEETDLGDEPVVDVSSVQSNAPATAAVVTRSRHRERPKARDRRVKVKPMPDVIKNKWPDVITMLLTTQSGKQVLFVKG